MRLWHPYAWHFRWINFDKLKTTLRTRAFSEEKNKTMGIRARVAWDGWKQTSSNNVIFIRVYLITLLPFLFHFFFFLSRRTKSWKFLSTFRHSCHKVSIPFNWSYNNRQNYLSAQDGKILSFFYRHTQNTASLHIYWKKMAKNMFSRIYTYEGATTCVHRVCDPQGLLPLASICRMSSRPLDLEGYRVSDSVLSRSLDSLSQSDLPHTYTSTRTH